MQRLAKERMNHGRIVEYERLAPQYSGPAMFADTYRATNVMVTRCKIEILAPELLPSKEAVQLSNIPEADYGDDEPSHDVCFDHGLQVGDYVKLHFANGLCCQWKKMPPYDVKSLLKEIKLKELKLGESLPESPAQEARRKGNELFKAGEYERASALYSRAINLSSKDDKQGSSTLHSNRAQALLNLGHFPQALVDCEEAVRLDSSNVKAYLRRARALIQLADGSAEKLQDAIASLEKVLELEPMHKQASEELSKLQDRLTPKDTTEQSEGDKGP